MPDFLNHTNEYYDTHDVDWFAIINGVVIHVASAGGLIPDAVKKNLSESSVYVAQLALIEKEEVITISDNFISERLGIPLGQIIDDVLLEYNLTRKEAYLSSFKLMARRGLYSFDKTNINDPTDNHYHLVAWPTSEDNRLKPEDSSKCQIPVLNSINVNFGNPESLTDVDFTPLLWDAD